ncbi:type II toxin-antitoxin system HicA family toxin [Fusibacter ferrireducens]|uniref:Type II toxin-antitoxin system HicA family toxin n=1 Tax=Fusibacter ferrireducens TaxID=2785058 RepID=A0ABR9ZM07_9FIRM|nr:type II toxin-antitoxin system HicA family toxin [Fusibacter ferrireducens]MBF4691498.1 type II toxin-antitoxin system HicA family toxin [Fusibacter ferrireducens]
MNQRSYNSRELLKLLTSDGWYVIRINGSHHQLKHPTKSGTITITVTVTHLKNDLPRKTFESILN